MVLQVSVTPSQTAARVQREHVMDSKGQRLFDISNAAWKIGTQYIQINTVCIHGVFRDKSTACSSSDPKCGQEDVCTCTCMTTLFLNFLFILVYYTACILIPIISCPFISTFALAFSPSPHNKIKFKRKKKKEREKSHYGCYSVTQGVTQ